MLRAQPWPGARSTWSCGMTLQEGYERKHGMVRVTTHAAPLQSLVRKWRRPSGPAPRSFVCISRTSGRAAGNRVIDHRAHRGPHERDKHGVEIEAGDAGCAERGEEITTHHGSYDAEHNI